MSYREVTMIEVKEVLRLWVAGTPTKRVAAMLGLDPKTVRRYVKGAAGVGLTPGSTPVSEAEVTAVLMALHPASDRPHGKTWAQCETERAKIKAWLAGGIRLTKIGKLLAVSYTHLTLPTIYSV